jgi:hypothetical protein
VAQLKQEPAEIIVKSEDEAEAQGEEAARPVEAPVEGDEGAEPAGEAEDEQQPQDAEQRAADDEEADIMSVSSEHYPDDWTILPDWVAPPAKGGPGGREGRGRGGGCALRPTAAGGGGRLLGAAPVL